MFYIASGCHLVFFLMLVFAAQDFIDDVAVVRKQNQAFRGFVEASDGEDTLGVIDEINDIARHARRGGQP